MSLKIAASLKDLNRYTKEHKHLSPDKRFKLFWYYIPNNFKNQHKYM